MTKTQVIHQIDEIIEALDYLLDMDMENTELVFDMRRALQVKEEALNLSDDDAEDFAEENSLDAWF